MSASTPPTVIRAGETISFVASKYSPEDDYTLEFVLNNGVDDPTTVAGEADGARFNVSMAAPAKPGRYAWAEVYTDEDGAIEYGPQGYIEVLPSLLTKQTPSFAAGMVTKLRAVMEKFASTDKQSVSIDGESFSRASISEYQLLLTQYEAKVAAEQAAVAGATGNGVGGFIHVSFGPPRSINCGCNDPC